jgi:hypothetical protein
VERIMKLRCALCSLLCAGLLGSVAFGQPPGGGRGMGMGFGGGNALSLIKSKDVVADVKLTEEQVKKLEELEKKMGEKRREAMQNRDDREAMMEAMQNIQKETEKGLSEAVSADQAKRLKQLVLQSTIKNGGLMIALRMNQEVAKAVNLNDEQKEQLQGFQEDMMNTMREMREGGGGDPQEMMKKMQEFRTSIDKKIAKMLTEEQTKKLNELKGEEFKGTFPAPQMGGRRGPGKNG